MNLQDAKRVAYKIQCLLDPNNDYGTLVEPFFIMEYIKSDCARVQVYQKDTGLRVPSPCVNILVTSDDTVDGPAGDALLFTYYDGDDIPCGPKHALLITKLPEKLTVYWCKRGQDPRYEWHYNALAKGQINFRFLPNYAGPEFMPRDTYYGFLCETITNARTQSSDTIAHFLGITNSAKFAAEIAYLQYWNLQHAKTPLRDGIYVDLEIDHTNKSATVKAICNLHNNIPKVTIMYDLDPDNSGYGVMILDDDNLVYQRQAGQDELTEWEINSMANDPIISDGYGHPFFIGEPTNI